MVADLPQLLARVINKWLNNVKVDIKHLTQIAIYSPAKMELIDMSYLRTNNSQSPVKKAVTPQERAKLQEGKMDLQMSDDELVDFSIKI